MGRIWAFGDISERARRMEAAKAAFGHTNAEELADQRGLEGDDRERFISETFPSMVAGARRQLELKGHRRFPNYEEHGVATPMDINGERYQALSVQYDGEDRVVEAVRRNGPYIATKRVRLLQEGESTRVVASTRGG